MQFKLLLNCWTSSNLRASCSQSFTFQSGSRLVFSCIAHPLPAHSPLTRNAPNSFAPLPLSIGKSPKRKTEKEKGKNVVKMIHDIWYCESDQREPSNEQGPFKIGKGKKTKLCFRSSERAGRYTAHRWLLYLFYTARITPLGVGEKRVRFMFYTFMLALPHAIFRICIKVLSECALACLCHHTTFYSQAPPPPW